MPPTPLQAWFDAARATLGLSLREVARKVGVFATTVFHYKRGAMLPAADAQRRHTTLEAALQDALSIALPIMEHRAPR